MPKKTKKSKEEKTINIPVSSLDVEGILWEQVITPDGPKFVSRAGGEANFFEQGRFRYVPIYDKIVRTGVVRFPSEVGEFDGVTQILKEIQMNIRNYVEVTPAYEQITAYYVLLTWFYDRFRTIGYLRVLGDYGSGKSRYQDVVGAMCYKPVFVTGAISTSAVFHVIDRFKGTLIIDEADFKDSAEHMEIIKIFNAGYSSGRPVLRAEPVGDGKFKAVPYDVYGPKVIGSRKRFRDEALESRCLTEVMLSMTRDDIPIEIPDEFWEKSLEIRNKLLSYRLSDLDKISVLGGRLVDIEPRINQIINPILDIIETEEDRRRVLDFARQVNMRMLEERGTLLDAWVAEAICSLYYDGGRLSMKNIAEWINERYNLDDPLTARRIGGKVRAMNIPKYKTGGAITVKATDKLIENLTKRYSITLDIETDQRQKLDVYVGEE